MGRTAVLQAGKVLRIPAKPAGVEPEDDTALRPIPVSTKRKIHVVKKGETLYSISHKLGVSQEDLQRWNGLRKADLTAGKKLVYHPTVKTEKVE